MNRTPTISGIVNTRNAAETLDLCLASLVPWVDEIVVVDMYSTDETQEIARRYGARMLFHEPMGYADPARMFAVNAARSDWVMILDADEVVPLDLARTLLRIAREDQVDVVAIPWANHLFGELPRHGLWGPTSSKHRRFFRAGSLQWSTEVHVPPAPVDGARLLTLPLFGEAVQHYNYDSIAEFMVRNDRYTTIEADRLHAQGAKDSVVRTFIQASRSFAASYIKHRGYRDGAAGLYGALLLAFYRVLVGAKHRQLGVAGTADDVARTYRAQAERLIAQYQDAADMQRRAEPPASTGT